MLYCSSQIAGVLAWRNTQMADMHRIAVLLMVTASACFGASAGSVADKARQAVKEGAISFKLTTPDEMKELLGPPEKEEKRRDGDANLLNLQYPEIRAVFARIAMEPGFARNAPYILYQLTIKDEPVDIGEERLIVLKRLDDLAKFDTFLGYIGASLANLDLRASGSLLEARPFDSRTQWPGKDKLPEDFDPARRLEEGEHPGLGIESLHKQGIDGRGIGIAIIDQPLLKEHEEYAGRLKQYEAIDVEGVPVKMHGAPVCSIAVGARCGVAPQATLYYYANPPWKWLDNKPWAELLEKIVESDKTRSDGPRIRVVSISLGAFSERPNFDLWKAAVDKANRSGILVVTCDPKFLRIGTLRRDPHKDPNDPASYSAGRYFAPFAALCVPAGNRTTASHSGRDVYTYWVEGGMSWTVPYLAGLAALAFQVNPEIPPARIAELWTATATRTAVGPIVNPPKFIEAVRSGPGAKVP
jgi:serine protease AprX